jgi:signal peptidase II
MPQGCALGRRLPAGRTLKAKRRRECRAKRFGCLAVTRRTLALVACVAGLVGCDHATKEVAQSSLYDRPPLAIVPGLLDVRYAENRDIAFDGLARLSLRSSATALVAFGVVVTALTIGVWWRRRHARLREHLGFALLVGGALGNVVDRAARGHVVDFIHVRGWPVFNLADILVVIGIAVLLWADTKRTLRPLPTLK